MKCLLLAIMFVSGSASAVSMSAGYKGQGIQNLMKSDGAVVTFRPIPKVGLSYSYNYARLVEIQA